jgi:uncharacterized protein YjiS (DUF1127 family)
MLSFPMSVPAASPAPASVSSCILRLAAEAARLAAGWAERRRQLRALSELDDHLLRDIGLTQDDIAHACARPFWALKSLLAERPAAR